MPVQELMQNSNSVLWVVLSAADGQFLYMVGYQPPDSLMLRLSNCVGRKTACVVPLSMEYTSSSYGMNCTDALHTNSFLGKCLRLSLLIFFMSPPSPSWIASQALSWPHTCRVLISLHLQLDGVLSFNL